MLPISFGRRGRGRSRKADLNFSRPSETPATFGGRIHHRPIRPDAPEWVKRAQEATLPVKEYR